MVMFVGMGKKFWGLRVSFFYKLQSRKQKLSQIYLKRTTDKTFVLRQTIVFMWNNALQKNIFSIFLRVFLLSFYFARKTGHQASILWSFEIFLIS